MKTLAAVLQAPDDPYISLSGAYIAPSSTSGTNSAATVLGILYAVPFLLYRATTFNGFQFVVGVLATSGTARVGVYFADPVTGMPNKLAYDPLTLGSTAATGNISTAVTPFTLQPGFYWSAYMNTVGAPAMRALSAFAHDGAIVSAISSSTMTSGFNNNTAYSGTGLNTMPATFLANAGALVATTVAPIVAYKIQ